MKLNQRFSNPAGDLFADLDQLFNRAMRGSLFGASRNSQYPLGVYEAEDAWYIRTDLPGFRKEDLNLRVQDGVLNLEAEQDEDGRSFEPKVNRTLKLPDNIDLAAIEARLENGVLEVKLPKSAPDQPEALRIEIK